jgi:hypothetical protein
MRAVILIAIAGAAACGPANREGACKEKLVAGDLVVSEVFADYQAASGGTGADEGKEWIEIYNATGRPIELDGLTVVHGRLDGTIQHSHVLEDVTLAPGQFFTMGNTAQDLLPPYIDYGYRDDLGDLFNSEPGQIQLRCGDAEIDTAIYQNVRPGRSRQLSAALPPDFTVNDTPEAWCESSSTQFEPENYGTPGQDNDCTAVIVGKCVDSTGMRDTVGPGPGDLVITEVMPSPTVVSDAAGEWFEARVMKDIDLNGIGLDRAGDTAMPDLVQAADCVRVSAGAYVVFGRTTDPLSNGGLAPYGTYRFSLIAGSASVPGDVRIMNGSQIVDAVTWTSSRTGRSLSLDPDVANVTANDDASNFCDGSIAYNTVGSAVDYGTPSLPNLQCPAQPPPGQCLDGGVARPIVKPAAGQLVISEFLANPASTGTDATQEWFEITNTGTGTFDLNGLGLRGNTTTVNVISSADCKSIAPGDFALFAHGTDPATNGMLPQVDATFTFALAQSNGVLSVLDGATVLDTVTWSSGIQDGPSKQLAPGSINATANDNPLNFCDALPTQTYGNTTNLGTPRAANSCM